MLVQLYGESFKNFKKIYNYHFFLRIGEYFYRICQKNLIASSLKRVENFDTSQSRQTITSTVLPVLLNKACRCEANYPALETWPVSNMCSQVRHIQPVHVLFSFPVIPELRNST